MDLSNLNPLPKWEDHFHRRQKGEDWKWNEELKLGKLLYENWRELFGLVMAFAENLPEDDDDPLSTKSMIFQNAYIVAPKIISASGDTLYQIKMENAALIRFNCRHLWEQVAVAVLMGKADEEHKEVIEDAIENFKQIFAKWVSTFKKDDFEDDWGLF